MTEKLVRQAKAALPQTDIGKKRKPVDEPELAPKPKRNRRGERISTTENSGNDKRAAPMSPP